MKKTGLNLYHENILLNITKYMTHL